MKNIITDKLNSIAKQSNSKTRKVGCLIVLKTDDNKRYNFEGYNQVLTEIHNYQCNVDEFNNPYVYHAEAIALNKLTKFIHESSSINIKSIDIYVNWAPCVECTKKMIYLKLETLKKQNTRITLYYEKAKYTFDNQHHKTQRDDFIPKNVLQSVGIEVLKL